MNIMPLAIGWALLASVVAGLAFYRRLVTRNEDDYLHVDAAANVQQQSMTKKLESIDKWGKLLTIIAGVYGLLLVGLVLYNQWTQGSQIQ